MRDPLLLLFKKERSWANCSLHKRPRANCSRCSLQKSDHKQIAFNFFKKEPCQWFAHYLRKALSKKSNSFKKKHIFLMFLTVFDSFFPFLCLRANRSRRSLLSCSFLKSDRSDSISSVFKKERQWANGSRWSLKKSDCERIAPVALYKKSDCEQFAPVVHDKRARGLLFFTSESLFCSQ